MESRDVQMIDNQLELMKQQAVDAEAESVAIADMMANHTHIPYRLAGGTLLALLGLGLSVDITITWPTPMPVDVYAVDVIPLALLGKATAVPLTQTAADVTIRVTASVLVAAGSQFLVFARP